MYLEFFGLREEPFRGSPNPRFFFPTRLHQAAIAKNRYVVSEKLGLTVTIGQVGTGKTTIARLLHQEFIDAGMNAILIINPAFNSEGQLLRAIKNEFGIGGKAKAKVDLIALIQEYLIMQAYEKGKTNVVLIDEAQTMQPKLLEILRQLLNFESNDEKLIQICLFGQEELRPKLARAEALVNRIRMPSTLEALSFEDTAEMIRFRLETAGQRRKIFTDEAIKLIYEYSGGTPRTISNVCAGCLLNAYLHEANTVTEEIAAEVIREQIQKSVSERQKAVAARNQRAARAASANGAARGEKLAANGTGTAAAAAPAARRTTRAATKAS